MKNLRPVYALTLALVLILSTSSFGLSSTDDENYKVKENYRIKRTSDGTVSLYSLNTKGDKEEFVFTEFNADVLLMVYRRAGMTSIVKTLSKKYFMSKTDARRSVKMTINELENWDLIVKN